MVERKMGAGCPEILLVVMILFLSCWVTSINAANVSYDHRALLIDGKRRFLQSGSIHYPRSTPKMWPALIDLAKRGGLDVIQTYIFWDIHEPERGKYNFNGSNDVVQFVKTAAAAGLYVNLRIGPFACAEWNFGGFPVWLRFVPNIEFRTENAPFQAEMARFVTKIVTIMKNEKLFASQGGPIILSQIENEYGNVQGKFGPAGQVYLEWLTEMAEGLDTGVPWTMCQQRNAPAKIINTCNGYYCDNFSPNSHNKPKMWTENWTGWYHEWGKRLPYRPVEDSAYAVARFFAKGGSFQNYYMYHGGTNFGRTAGEMVTTSYDYDAPLDEYGHPRQPKWGHLKDLHAAIRLCEPALAVVDGDAFQIKLGKNQEAHVYANGQGSTLAEIVKSSTICASFLSNTDASPNDTTVKFNGHSYDLPAWSVSIMPDCKSVTFNTAKVGSQTSVTKMTPATLSGLGALQWETYQEPLPVSGSIKHTGELLEHINVTMDSSDYLWYMTSVQVPSDLKAELLLLNRSRDVVQAFVNGMNSGSSNVSFAIEANFSQPIQLKSGTNTITVLSTMLGLQATTNCALKDVDGQNLNCCEKNHGARFEREVAGVKQVQIDAVSNGNSQNLTDRRWTYKVGMQGEQLKLFTSTGAKHVTWQSGTPVIKQALVWYKTMVDAPLGDGAVAVDLGSMGKGQAWINGYNIGRYWTIQEGELPKHPGGTCSHSCDYRGHYNSRRCSVGCGEPTQRWYHVPREWLQPTKNFLVLFEEIGGNPTNVTLVVQTPKKVCVHVSEVHPVAMEDFQRNSSSGISNHGRNYLKSKGQHPVLELDCSRGNHISQVIFGSFGNPAGSCGIFEKGSCHARSSMPRINKECIGKQLCSFEVSWKTFATKDPCRGQPKSLAIEALCTINK